MALFPYLCTRKKGNKEETKSFKDNKHSHLKSVVYSQKSKVKHLKSMTTLEFKPQLIATLRNYNRQKFMTDLMAGIIVGIVALPLAIAFGIASGVTPEKGIITAIVAGLIISVLGGSKVQIGGPTGAFIIIIYGIIQQYGMEGLTIATLLAGVFLIMFGVLHLGTIIKYIPYPIIVGFTSGIALTIFTTQIKDLLGLVMEEVPSDFIEKWGAYFGAMPTIDWWSAAVGIGSVALIAAWPRMTKWSVFNGQWSIFRKLPGSLIAIIVMTIVALLLKQYAGVTTIETIGDRFSISSELPGAEVPALSWETIKGLVQPAITIAILGAIESLLSATVADGVIGARHSSNTELIAQGVANLASPIFGGIPATGAIARTMTNINNGGRTPVAGIVHAAVLLLIFLFLMPLAQYIPMACLAGVLVVVSYGMSGWRSFLSIMKNPKSDVIVLWVTFLLTVIFDLTIAIEVGLICACLLFMRRMAETTEVKVISDEINPAEEDSDFQLGNLEHLTIPEGVEVYEINGPYFFGAGNKFEEIMGALGHHRPKVRIIRMRKVPFVDSTGIHNLTNLCLMSQREGIQVVLSGVSPQVQQTLHRAKFDQLVGTDNICSHINLALDRAQQLLGSE